MEGRLELAHALKDVGWAEGDHVRSKKDSNRDKGWILVAPENPVQQCTQPVDALEAVLGYFDDLLFSEKDNQPLEAAVSHSMVNQKLIKG